jgi:hypothetical protein
LFLPEFPYIQISFQRCPCLDPSRLHMTSAGTQHSLGSASSPISDVAQPSGHRVPAAPLLHLFLLD